MLAVCRGDIGRVVRGVHYPARVCPRVKIGPRFGWMVCHKQQKSENTGCYPRHILISRLSRRILERSVFALRTGAVGSSGLPRSPGFSAIAWANLISCCLFIRVRKAVSQEITNMAGDNQRNPLLKQDCPPCPKSDQIPLTTGEAAPILQPGSRASCREFLRTIRIGAAGITGGRIRTRQGAPPFAVQKNRRD